MSPIEIFALGFILPAAYAAWLHIRIDRLSSTVKAVQADVRLLELEHQGLVRRLCNK
jgi:hypothetical protein